MYFATAKDLARWQPLPKFLCVKAIVFFSYWQGLALSILASLGVLQYILGNSDTNFALLIQNAMICVEMVFAALGHYFYFSYKEYAPRSATTAARMRLFYAFKDAFGISDVLEDAREAWSGNTYTYSHFEPIVQLDELDSPLPTTYKPIPEPNPEQDQKMGKLSVPNDSHSKNLHLSKQASENTRLVLHDGSLVPDVEFTYSSQSRCKILNKPANLERRLLTSFKSSDLYNSQNESWGHGNTSSTKSINQNGIPCSESLNELRDDSTNKSTSTSGSKHPLFVSQKRLKAGMRYTKGGEKTYWIDQKPPSIESHPQANIVSHTKSDNRADVLNLGFRIGGGDFEDMNELGSVSHLSTNIGLADNVSARNSNYFSYGNQANQSDRYISVSPFAYDGKLLNFEKEAFGENFSFKNEIDALYKEAKMAKCDINVPVISMDYNGISHTGLSYQDLYYDRNPVQNTNYSSIETR